MDLARRFGSLGSSDNCPGVNVVFPGRQERDVAQQVIGGLDQAVQTAQERTAACKAISEGHRDFVRIAVYGDGEGYCYPCGACRQFLAEFAPEMEVLSAKRGRYVSNKLSELMPYTFNF